MLLQPPDPHMGLSCQHTSPALSTSPACCSHSLCLTDVAGGGRTTHDAVNASRASHETLLPILLEHRSHKSAGMLFALMPGRFMTAQALLCWSQHPLLSRSPVQCLCGHPPVRGDTQHLIQYSRAGGDLYFAKLPCWSSRGDAGLQQTDSPSAPDGLAVPACGILPCRMTLSSLLCHSPSLGTFPAQKQTASCSSGTHWEYHR